MATERGANKRKRNVSSGWQRVIPDDEFLLGADDGGFAGLEVLTDPTLLDASLHSKIFQGGDNVESGKGGNGKKRRKHVKAKAVSIPAERATDLAGKGEERKDQGTKGDQGKPGGIEGTAELEGMNVQTKAFPGSSGSSAHRPSQSTKRSKVHKPPVMDDPVGARASSGEPTTSSSVGKKTKKGRQLMRQRKLDENPLNEPGLEPSQSTMEMAEAEVDMRAWHHMSLHLLLERALAQQNFVEPLPIQQECILPATRDRRDVIGAAPTGSGKTLAFGIPILQVLLQEREQKAAIPEGPGHLRALILTPTRELALQVSNNIKALARPCGIRVCPLVGGMAQVKQERLLKKGPQVVVATPGRLWDLMRQGEVHLTHLDSLSFLVLDEADRMIQQGHYQELDQILGMVAAAHGQVKGEPVEDEVVEAGAVDDMPGGEKARDDMEAEQQEVERLPHTRQTAPPMIPVPPLPFRIRRES